MVYKRFEELVEKCVKDPHKRTVAIAGGADEHVISAAIQAEDAGIIIPAFIGDADRIRAQLCSLGRNPVSYKIFHADTPQDCGETAVKLVKDGLADFIMKGMVDTRDVLKPLVKKENGMQTGRTMCIFAYHQVPQLNRLVVIADGGMIPYPTLEQKRDIVINCVEAFHRLGIEKPSIAALAAAEKVSPKIVDTTDAQALAHMQQNGEISGCHIVGPISLDIAMSPQIAAQKKYDCPYCGDFDMMLVPNMSAGNMAGKAMILCGGAKMAGVVVGAKVPVALTSRGASIEEKFVSLALASLMADPKKTF